MAGSLICRQDTPEDRPQVLDLVESVYSKRPGEKIFPDDRLVVEEDGKIVGFAALYRLDDVVIGAVDWCAIEEGRKEADMVAILGALIEGMRDLKTRYALRAIMIHTPYDEIRQHLSAADLHEGEQKIRRLSFYNSPLQD